MEYRNYLRSKHWQKKRNQVKYWYDNKCIICGNKSIDIHHKTYKDLGDEDPIKHLVPLCRTHHFDIHNMAKKDNIHIYHMTNSYIERNSVKPKKLQWKDMSRLERDNYLGKGL